MRPECGGRVLVALAKRAIDRGGCSGKVFHGSARMSHAFPQRARPGSRWRPVRRLYWKNLAALSRGDELVIADSLGGLTLNSIAAPVPEPGTYALMLAGIGLIGALLPAQGKREAIGRREDARHWWRPCVRRPNAQNAAHISFRMENRKAGSTEVPGAHIHGSYANCVDSRFGGRETPSPRSTLGDCGWSRLRSQRLKARRSRVASPTTDDANVRTRRQGDD